MEYCKENSLLSSARFSDSCQSHCSGKKELSSEQRRRIDQNFRAAKAILSRKRSINDDPVSPHCRQPPKWAPAPFSDGAHSKIGAHQELQEIMLTPPIAAVKAVKTCDSYSSTKNLSSSGECTSRSLKSNINSNSKLSEAFLERSCLKRYTIENGGNSEDSSVINRTSSYVRISVESNRPTSISNLGLLLPHNEQKPMADFDLDAKMLKKLDSFSSARAPLAQLSTNRPPEQSQCFCSKDISLCSIKHVRGFVRSAESPAKSGDTVHELQLNSFTKLDAFDRTPSFSTTICPSEDTSPLSLLEDSDLQQLLSNIGDASVNISGEVLQSHTTETCSDTSFQEDLPPGDSVGVQGGGKESSIDCQTSSLESRLHKKSVGDHPMQILNPMVDVAAIDISPNSSTLDSCSNKISAHSIEMMPSYLQTLNETQREAVLSDLHKPLLILAGPGSGKTSTMVARLLCLLNEGVQATNILAMTFTTAAAMEMKERVAMHVGKVASKELNVCTFHSFCLQLCRSNAEKLGRSPEFLVYGHSQQRRAVIESIRRALPEFQSIKDPTLINDGSVNSGSGCQSDHFCDPKYLKERAKRWDKFVTQAKASGHTPEYFESQGNVSGAAVLRHYDATLASCDALDYHDFINYSVSLLSDDNEVYKDCLSKWTCLLVDEFQDTSKMQYELLRLLGAHKRITVVGDDDQSIFSFNGADSNNFEMFRKDFPDLKEVRLQHNYRSTRCIVEAAAALIGNNLKRCEDKQTVTDNGYGELISVKECRNDEAQCCFVIDTIIMNAQKISLKKAAYGDFAILYRRQVTGKIFQKALRLRKIPFNVHGVAFYRKKIVKTIISMLWAALDGDDIYYSRVFKALFGTDKTEAKKVVEYVDKVAKASKIGFLEASRSVFTAKISGMFSRRQLACGRKVLSVIDTLQNLVRKECSLSTFISTVVNLVPQRASFDKRAVLDANDGKLLNEDDDPRTVLEYLLDDVTDFLSSHLIGNEAPKGFVEEANGCIPQLRSFLDHIALREHGNFKMRKEDNKNSVTLTTMHQSKGLEWDTVFIVKVNDSEIPLLHEARGTVCDRAASVEEERRLLYVGMTRAKRKLYILYTTWDSNQQLLQPSRFLRELPQSLLDHKVVGMFDSSNLTSSLDENVKKYSEYDNYSGPKATGNVACEVKEGMDSIRPPIGNKSSELEFTSSTDFLKGCLDMR
ncbi:hypothetical protein KP509_22G063300 [Ceratopteris richardii]|uniref:DNA 3'-5' helicase n=1 Tax=Ceratopteris richardii TaxID=49495 RepID=A0A8T2S5T4_CERRI|nr:hypothetical protein KP509_22G063300 [Ceratopteris richardii]